MTDDPPATVPLLQHTEVVDVAIFHRLIRIGLLNLPSELTPNQGDFSEWNVTSWYVFSSESPAITESKLKMNSRPDLSSA